MGRWILPALIAVNLAAVVLNVVIFATFSDHPVFNLAVVPINVAAALFCWSAYERNRNYGR